MPNGLSGAQVLKANVSHYLPFHGDRLNPVRERYLRREARA